jgi:hypothetical protein
VGKEQSVLAVFTDQIILKERQYRAAMLGFIVDAMASDRCRSFTVRCWTEYFTSYFADPTTRICFIATMTFASQLLVFRNHVMPVGEVFNCIRTERRPP